MKMRCDMMLMVIMVGLWVKCKVDVDRQMRLIGRRPRAKERWAGFVKCLCKLGKPIDSDHVMRIAHEEVNRIERAQSSLPPPLLPLKALAA